MSVRTWTLPFLSSHDQQQRRNTALIILNQPFSVPLLLRLWNASHWHCCADGGANRLHDALRQASGRTIRENGEEREDIRPELIPDLIKGDLDSLRPDVETYYSSQDVKIVRDDDQNSTDLMKCIQALSEKETEEGQEQYDLIILGGLSGRLDQTVHTLSLLHKLRRDRCRVFAVNDENVAWVLDEGEHHIEVDHHCFGPTCGLLPVGIDITTLSTRGLRWNLTDQESHFGGLMSTSNHLLPAEDVVYVKTSKPIWWTMELRPSLLSW